MPSVCVFCASGLDIDPRYLALAREVGTGIAERGWTLVSGAGSISMMGEIGSSARAAGGRTVGVIPEALVAMEVADHASDELIVTRDMRQRKGIMDERSDAFLALPGGIGTLEELVEVWTARSLNMHHKPVVVLDPWGDFRLLREQVEHWQAQGFVRAGATDHVHWATQTSEALDEIAESLAARNE
jgi:uncharacterized protein (TIGR00730 family)